MSSETAAIDQSGQERSVDNQGATATGLEIITRGFAVYATQWVDRQPYILGVAAPRVHGYDHPTQLEVPASAKVVGLTETHPHTEQLSARGTRLIDISGYDLSLGEEQQNGSSAEGLRAFLPVEQVCCGAQLAKNWHERPIVDSWLSFGPGTVRPTPLHYDSEWRWSGCDESAYEELLTTATRYTPLVWKSRTIVCAPRRDGRLPGFIVFADVREHVRVTFFHELPVHSGSGPKVDKAHIESVVRLTDSELSEVHIRQLTRRTGNQTVGRPYCGAWQMLAR